jgi:hypothetical protein
MTELNPYVRVLVVVDQRNIVSSREPLAAVHTITSDESRARQAAATLRDRAAQAGHPVPNLAVTQTVWSVPLPEEILNLIDMLTDPDQCELDHHGTCQLHGQGSDPYCAHARAQALLAQARTEGVLPINAHE